MSKVKKILAYLLTLAMVVSCFAGVELTAKATTTSADAEELHVDETHVVSISQPGEHYWVKFTPEEDGNYCFYSDPYNFSEGDPMAALYEDVNEEPVAESDDAIGMGLNFKIRYDMTAGKTYYLDTFLRDEPEVGAYSIRLTKSVAATEVFIEEEYLTGILGETATLKATFIPLENSIEETLSWTSSNQEVATVDEDGYVEFLSEGTATITVTSANGLVDTCSVTVKEPRVLELDKVVTVENAQPGSQEIFYFTPSKTSYYAFCSDTDLDVYAYLYTIEGVYVAQNDDCETGDYNFQVKAELEEGVTYVLESNLYTLEPAGNYDVYVTELKQPTEMSFESDKLVGYVGGVLYEKVQFGPGLVVDEEFDVTSSDDNKVSVSKDDSGYVNLVLNEKGTATITATSTSGLISTCTVTVMEPESLALDEANTVDLLEGQETVKFVFTPDETAEYVFYSTDGSDAYVELTSEETGWLGNNNGGGTGKNFKISYELQQGKTYYYTCYMSNDVESLSVMLKKATEATGITMEYSEMTLYVGNSANLEVNVQPENGVTNVTFESSDTDVADVHVMDGMYPYVIAQAEGTATITATSENGLTATCKVTVLPIPEIKLNDTKTINIEADYQIGSYTFTPEKDGKYVLTTKGSEEVVFVVIYDEEEMDVYRFKEGNGDEPNVTIEVELKAGVKYYIRTGYKGDVGSYELSLYDAANPPIVTPDDTADKDDTTSSDATNDTANGSTTDNNTVNSSATSAKTGDTQVTWIWVVLMMATVLGAFIVVTERKKNR